MKKNFRNLTKVITAVLATTMLFANTVFAADTYAYQNGGTWINGETFTWLYNDGTTVSFDKGPVFAIEHPEITDYEYYLRETVVYPGETGSVLNKVVYDERTLTELRNFVNSFDWIHSDELTRINKVFERIANEQHGNTYGMPERSQNTLPLLIGGKGICGDFATEFAILANSVGVECVYYMPSQNHAQVLAKIGEQWFAVNPTVGFPFFSNSMLYPADYETETTRVSKELAAERQAEIDSGSISGNGYALIDSGATTEEIQEWYRNIAENYGNEEMKEWARTHSTVN